MTDSDFNEDSGAADDTFVMDFSDDETDEDGNVIVPAGWADAERDELDHEEIDAGSDRRKTAVKTKEEVAVAGAPFPVVAGIPGSELKPEEPDEFDGITLPVNWAAMNYDERLDWENPTPGSMTVHEQRMRKLVAATWRATHPDEVVERVRAADSSRVDAFDWMENSITAESWDDTTPPTPPTICRIEGGVGALFGAGRLSRIYGLSGSAKSWLAKKAMLEVVQDGGSGLYLDADGFWQDFRDHLKAMGLSREDALSGRLHHLRVQGSLRSEAYMELVRSQRWTLIVLDGYNRGMMTSGGLKGSEDPDVNLFHETVLEPALKHGCAVLLVDHMKKDGESDHGSVFKQNNVTGIDLAIKRLSAFAPGMRGHSSITLTAKDREGWATATHLKRNKSQNDPFAYVVVDSTGTTGTDTVVTIELDEPLDLIVRSTLVQANADADRLRDLLRDNPGGFDSGGAVYNALTARKQGMTNPQITAAAKILVADGEATRTKVGRAFDLRPTSKLTKP